VIEVHHLLVGLVGLVALRRAAVLAHLVRAAPADARVDDDVRLVLVDHERGLADALHDLDGLALDRDGRHQWPPPAGSACAAGGAAGACSSSSLRIARSASSFSISTWRRRRAFCFLRFTSAFVSTGPTNGARAIMAGSISESAAFAPSAMSWGASPEFSTVSPMFSPKVFLGIPVGHTIFVKIDSMSRGYS